MPKNKALAVIEGFAEECVISGARDNILRVRLSDGSFSGDISVDVLLKLLEKKKPVSAQRSQSTRESK